MNTLHKILHPKDAVHVADRHRHSGEPIVFTNGCFDVLHVGHLSLLERASDRGLLFVGVNSDQAVKKLKGPMRPINSLDDRMRLLSALEPVHIVFEVDSVDMVGTLTALRPDYWVKSDQYTMETLNQEEVKAANSVNAKILLLMHVIGYSSTTAILGKAKYSSDFNKIDR